MTVPDIHRRLFRRELSLAELLADGIVHALALVAGLVAASIGVLTRFGVAQYQASLLYKGQEDRAKPGPARKPPARRGGGEAE